MWEFFAGYFLGSADRSSERKDKVIRGKRPGELVGLLWLLIPVAGIIAYNAFDITLVQAMWSIAAIVGIVCGVIAATRGYAFPAVIMIASAFAFAYTVFFTDFFGSPDLPCLQDRHVPWEHTRDCSNASDSVGSEQ